MKFKLEISIAPGQDYRDILRILRKARKELKKSCKNLEIQGYARDGFHIFINDESHAPAADGYIWQVIDETPAYSHCDDLCY